MNTKLFDIRFRAALYVGAVICPILADQLKTYADTNTMPSLIKWIWILIVALGAGFVTLRAYYDGSAERHKQSSGGAPPPALSNLEPKSVQ